MKPRPGAEPHTLTGDLVKACGDGRVWKPRHVTLRPDLRVAVYAKPGHVTEASVMNLFSSLSLARSNCVMWRRPRA
jgi:hypothetical protein